jgi:thymidylate synthase (FAD)
MRIIQPNFEIIKILTGDEILKLIEQAGRICYKSENVISDLSAPDFVEKLIKSGHESVIEHFSVSVKIICDRGISHEIVRHRIASYSQESTRYCNYSDDKFGSEITFIEPFFFNDDEKYEIWQKIMLNIENAYMELIKAGAKPEEARSILPNSLKTELIMTMNLREWRHFFRLRTTKSAHPQMQEIMKPLLYEFKRYIPVIFDEIGL